MSSTVFSREYLKLAPRDTERRVQVGISVQIGLHALDEYPLHPGALLSVHRRAVNKSHDRPTQLRERIRIQYRIERRAFSAEYRQVL